MDFSLILSWPPRSARLQNLQTAPLSNYLHSSLPSPVLFPSKTNLSYYPSESNRSTTPAVATTPIMKSAHRITSSRPRSPRKLISTSRISSSATNMHWSSIQTVSPASAAGEPTVRKSKREMPVSWMYWPKIERLVRRESAMGALVWYTRDARVDRVVRRKDCRIMVLLWECVIVLWLR